MHHINKSLKLHAKSWNIAQDHHTFTNLHFNQIC